MDKWLRPCPFCGGEAKLKKHMNRADISAPVAYMVQCLHCTGTAGATTEEQAIAIWNTRAGEKSFADVLEEELTS